MESESWLLLVTTLAVSLLYYLASVRRRSSSGARRPRGLRPLLLIGNILDLCIGNLHHTLARLARAHSPIMRLELGLTTVVVISSRDAAAEAFTRHDRRLAAQALPNATHALEFSERSMVCMLSSDPRWKHLCGVMAANIFTVHAARKRKVRDLVGYLRGSDTIVITVEWAMAELLRKRDAMDKVRAEIKATIGGKEAIEEPDTASLLYLHAVMKEAMRLHLVAPILLPNQAIEDGVEIGGYTMPRGWPEGVPRHTIAERVVPFILASLLHAFEWRLRDGMSTEKLDMTKKFTTDNVMAVPLKAVPVVV
uniref:Cytochrome P450 n=1 Tax=Setaria italica TaxID=4555 RepID=K3YN90_SETIT